MLTKIKAFDKITLLFNNCVILRGEQMRLLNDELAAKILDAAKSEFLEKGYRQASVRSIAAAAGVTTGALYRYYANKEALFDALVSAPADELYQWYREFSEAYSRRGMDEQIANLPEVAYGTKDNISEFKYIYQHYDAFKLIACCATGTKYENYIEKLIDVETKSTVALVRLMQQAGRLGADVDDTMIHIVASSMFTAVFEVIAHDESVESAARHIGKLREFYTAGWLKILRIE